MDETTPKKYDTRVPLLVVAIVAICVALAAAACGDDGPSYSTRSGLQLDVQDGGALDPR